ELGQCGVNIVSRPHQRIIDSLTGAAAPDFSKVLSQCIQIAVAQGTRIAQELGKLLHPLKACAPREREIQLILVEDVEYQEIVSAVPKHLQTAEERLALGQ